MRRLLRGRVTVCGRDAHMVLLGGASAAVPCLAPETREWGSAFTVALRPKARPSLAIRRGKDP